MDQEVAREIVAACEQASAALTAAEAAIARMQEGEERSRHLRALAGLLASLFGELRAPAVRQYPDLDKTEPLGDPDTVLDADEQELVSRLTQPDLELIDGMLIANSASSWRKVARVVGTAMSTLRKQFPGVPDGFYAQRVVALVQRGELQAQGNLEYMRFSEVRLPRQGQSAA
jgi:hypothetical protein